MNLTVEKIISQKMSFRIVQQVIEGVIICAGEDYKGYLSLKKNSIEFYSLENISERCKLHQDQLDLSYIEEEKKIYEFINIAKKSSDNKDFEFLLIKYLKLVKEEEYDADTTFGCIISLIYNEMIYNDFQDEDYINDLIYLIIAKQKSIINQKRIMQQLTGFVMSGSTIYKLQELLIEAVEEAENIEAAVISKEKSRIAKIKAEQYREKMTPIFDDLFEIFQNFDPKTKAKWTSKNKCAKYFIRQFYQKNPNTKLDLDPKKLVSEITRRINDHYASKKVI